jgi:hypothetical protein
MATVCLAEDLEPHRRDLTMSSEPEARSVGDGGI